MTVVGSLLVIGGELTTATYAVDFIGDARHYARGLANGQLEELAGGCRAGLGDGSSPTVWRIPQDYVETAGNGPLAGRSHSCALLPSGHLVWFCPMTDEELRLFNGRETTNFGRGFLVLRVDHLSVEQVAGPFHLPWR